MKKSPLLFIEMLNARARSRADATVASIYFGIRLLCTHKFLITNQ